MKIRDRLDLDRVVFIGRTFGEYLGMFDLDSSVLRCGSILDCGAGPSSFTAEAHRAGILATACDPCYELSAEVLGDKGRDDIDHVFDRFESVEHLYTWNYYRNREALIACRRRALESFLADFLQGIEAGRYIGAALPRLPFPDRTFSLVLCSHFLFLYHDRLDLDFHKASLLELMRVGRAEVRVFPLQGLDAQPYPHLDEIIMFLAGQGVVAEIVGVPFEFQKGSNKMLRLRRMKG
ncbi:MAG: class I SAM-dependent methyltransferase [Proteobacteria bacterium]|nr:class I SAM-dependent methyltransferase [Pseudomonadota bacterium]MBU1686126.1 class I SAM-dependent methyltransferase [Pseudomonadota bacterium]